MAVPTEVGEEVTTTLEDALPLRLWSRTRRPVPRSLSCPARSPRVWGRCGHCGRRGMTTTA
jgi:hypothetical protein